MDHANSYFVTVNSFLNSKHLHLYSVHWQITLLITLLNIVKKDIFPFEFKSTNKNNFQLLQFPKLQMQNFTLVLLRAIPRVHSSSHIYSRPPYSQIPGIYKNCYSVNVFIFNRTDHIQFSFSTIHKGTNLTSEDKFHPCYRLLYCGWIRSGNLTKHHLKLCVEVN